MIFKGTAPLSSGIYFTKRKRLSETLSLYKVEGSGQNYALSFGGAQYSGHSSKYSSDLLLYKSLLSLSLDRRRLEISDDVTYEVEDDLVEGLRFLSQHLPLQDIDDLTHGLNEFSTSAGNIVGRIDDVLDLLDVGDISQRDLVSLNIIEKDIGLNDRCIGPLNVNEVANLIALAFKLQETERFDVDLEKRLEVSTQLWRKTNKIPSTISVSLISSLFENRIHQCTTCGMRFKTNDLKTRHMATHEKTRKVIDWYPLDCWINVTSRGIYGFSASKSLLTLESFRVLFNEVESENEYINWLKRILIPNNTAMLQEDYDGINDYEGYDNAPLNDTTRDLLDDSLSWSWGTMSECNTIPTHVDTKKEDTKLKLPVNISTLDRVFKTISSNIDRFNVNTPVLAAFGDTIKGCCVICQDVLEHYLDVKYNDFVYKNVKCFQFDPHLISHLFNDEYVPYEDLLSLNLLELNHPFEVLRKIATFRILPSNLEKKTALYVTNWPYKKCDALFNIKYIITPETTKDIPDATCKITKDLFKGWTNPFKNGPNSILYAHGNCLKMVINTHIMYARDLCEDLDDTDETDKGIYSKELNLLKLL